MKRSILNRPGPVVYLITDRHQLRTSERSRDQNILFDFLDAAIAAGVDLIQIREKDLTARELFSIAERMVRTAATHGVQVLINDRVDVAVAAGAGVHLTTQSMKADVIRNAFGGRILIGASTHSMAEAAEAETGGADFVVFGPVFHTEKRQGPVRPAGLAALRDVAAKLSIPVLALGGIKLSNCSQVLDQGVAGIAAVSLFAGSPDLSGVVAGIKTLAR